MKLIDLIWQIIQGQNIKFFFHSQKKRTERSIFKSYHQGILSFDKKTIYFFGIIDLLTEYSIMKRGEKVAKSFIYDSVRSILI